MRWIKANEMGPDLKHKDQFGKMFSDNVICLDEDGEPHIACWAPIAPPPKECLGDDVL